jgi:hypothetical protein
VSLKRWSLRRMTGIICVSTKSYSCQDARKLDLDFAARNIEVHQFVLAARLHRDVASNVIEKAEVDQSAPLDCLAVFLGLILTELVYDD